MSDKKHYFRVLHDSTKEHIMKVLHITTALNGLLKGVIVLVAVYIVNMPE